MMAELREMARAPMAVFERFMGELQRLTADKAIAPSAGLERVPGLQPQTVREFEESLERFRARAEEAEAALVGLLRPYRPSLSEQIQRATQHLQHLRDLEARRAALLRAWGQQPAGDILEAYRDRLERTDMEEAELVEADVEDLLRRKGTAAGLQTYLHLRAQAEEGRLTAGQHQARADLEEIGRLKHELEMATRILASTLKVSGSLAAAGEPRAPGARAAFPHPPVDPAGPSPGHGGPPGGCEPDRGAHDDRAGAAPRRPHHLRGGGAGPRGGPPDAGRGALVPGGCRQPRPLPGRRAPGLPGERAVDRHGQPPG